MSKIIIILVRWPSGCRVMESVEIAIELTFWSFCVSRSQR